MKILVLAALFAAVASGRNSQDVDNQTQGTWRVGNVYKYAVDSYTLAKMEEGSNSGNSFQAQFVVRVVAPGRLVARLENPRHAQIHHELPENQEQPQEQSQCHQFPADLKYQPVDKLDQPFEINIDGGRVVSLNLPQNLPLTHENILKGLISALQVDLSPHRHVRREENGYDQQTQQGMFKKMETDVTGDCETMYNINPAAPEWRRELPKFAQEQEPIMITKTKNYGHCHHRVDYHFGVPQGAKWSGRTNGQDEDQFIKRATVSRILAGQQGPIYKTETTSSVNVNPHIYGEANAEVTSYVSLTLESYEPDQQPEWQQPQNYRKVNNLLYAMMQRQVTIRDVSSSSESDEDNNQYDSQQAQQQAEQQSQSSKRPRRSLDNEAIPQMNQQDYVAASLSQSTESDSQWSYANDELPKHNEPAYASMYMTPQARTDKKQNPANAQKLVQELAQLLQNPNNMPKNDFLSKFNVLTRVIASMSSEQLSLTNRGIEGASASNNKVKVATWMIFRDAVAQAGTQPAFQQIKVWIQAKKIQGEEAAEVVATLANTLRYPTKEIMLDFFRLAFSSEVKQQKNLQTAVLISATRFINRAQVNNETAHSYYPTHMYGRLARKHDAFVPEVILPRLSEHLKEAIQQGDNNQAQVYIQAIGNLGHRGILQVFAPYLEGKIPTSTYLRTQMVKNLQVIAHQRDSHARAVLFSILKNTGEPYEVRVAAIQNIFMARPNTAMMQAMAWMTHDDPSVQVRAVMKTSIQSAASLKNRRNWDLARTAQAAQWMLTKEDFGQQYSSKNLGDDEDFLAVFSKIGSQDNWYAKEGKYSIKTKAGGSDKENTISYSFSSIQQLINAIQKQIWKMSNVNQQYEPKLQLKYSAQKISEMLNIKAEPQNSLEASLLVALMGQERYLTFSEKDIQQLSQSLDQLMSEMTKGVEKNYIKVINQEQVSIMLPLASGMPFIYKYKTPTVVHFEGKANNNKNENSENRFQINAEVQVTYARNIEGSVGFMDTISNQHASVGVVSKFQVYVPLKLQTQMRFGDLKIQMEPLRANQDDTIIHYSVWPYSASQKKDSLVTVALDKATKAIARKNKVLAVDQRFGKSVGNQFQFEGYTYSSDLMNIDSLMSADTYTSIANFLYQKDVALTHFNFRHLGKQSPNNRITLRYALDTYYNQKQPAQPMVASNVADTSVNSEARRQEMLQRVGAGINHAEVKIVDLSATYEGKDKHEFVLTAAMANSKVSRKMQYAFFAGRNSAQLGNAQVNGVLTVNKPEVSALNFLEALQKDMKMNFEADIKYGQNSNIHMEGHTERTQEYAEQLKNGKRGQQCAEEIAKNNYYQLACHDMIIRAHAPDHLKASIKYKELDPLVRSLTYRAIRMFENKGYGFSAVDSAKVTPEGRFEIESRLNYLENRMSLVLGSKYGELAFFEVPIPQNAAHVFAVYSPISYEDRVGNVNSNHQFEPFCTVDANRIKTFSNRQYEYSVSKSWHVVMQDDGSRQGMDREELVVLARRTEEQKLEVYISHRSTSGKELEVEISDRAEQVRVAVNSNGEVVANQELTIYWDKTLDEPQLQYYRLPDGVLVVDIENRLRAMYRGNTLVLLSRDLTRNNTRGLCGFMNGDIRYDYLTPTGLVDKPEHFGASFALNTEDSDPKTQQLQSEAKELSYAPKNHFTVILPEDQQWRRSKAPKAARQYQTENAYLTKSYLKIPGKSCQVQRQVQYYEDHSEICVTTESLPTCQSRCKAEGYQVQEVEVMCAPKIDMEFRGYKDQIRKGQNPQVRGRPQQVKRFKVPNSCRA